MVGSTGGGVVLVGWRLVSVGGVVVMVGMVVAVLLMMVLLMVVIIHPSPNGTRNKPYAMRFGSTGVADCVWGIMGYNRPYAIEIAPMPRIYSESTQL